MPRLRRPGPPPPQYTTTYTYFPDQKVQTVTDGLGNQTGYTYDNAGNVRQVTDRANNPPTSAYDPDHRVQQVTDPNGNYTSTTRDADGRVTATRCSRTPPPTWAMAGGSACMRRWTSSAPCSARCWSRWSWRPASVTPSAVPPPAAPPPAAARRRHPGPPAWPSQSRRTPTASDRADDLTLPSSEAVASHPGHTGSNCADPGLRPEMGGHPMDSCT